MTRPHHPTALQMIPVDQIVVLNPRDRNGRVFEEIVGNIKKIGLKKPVTVTPRDDLEDGKRYLLICGEGRLKAFKSLGEKEIPALVVAVNDEDAFIMSLTENIARQGADIACRPPGSHSGQSDIMTRLPDVTADQAAAMVRTRDAVLVEIPRRGGGGQGADGNEHQEGEPGDQGGQAIDGAKRFHGGGVKRRLIFLSKKQPAVMGILSPGYQKVRN